MDLRIVSLVPSLTKMLADFGLSPQIIGCTSFCVDPPGLAKKATIVGGTKDPRLDAIKALAPTHILVNAEENRDVDIRACEALAPTLVTFPKGPADVPELLRSVGAWLGVSEVATTFAADAARALEDLGRAVAGTRAAGGWPELRYLYYIWRDPYMVAADDTYISAMLAAAGLKNAAPDTARYPELPVDEAKSCAPDLLLLSSEPYPFRKRDAARLKEEWPDAPPMLRIDGQQLSWYGTTTAPALRALAEWVQGKASPLARPLKPTS